ncbi:predicted protein, partial [Arabidopsis lyrata subsp. lyrata]
RKKGPFNLFASEDGSKTYSTKTVSSTKRSDFSLRILLHLGEFRSLELQD